MIGDPIAGTPPTSVFTDAQIQEALDLRRTVVIECNLAWRASTAPGGTVTYHDYFAPRGNWEDTVTLKDRTFNILVPTSADLLTGHWTFVNNQIGPVFITGATHDPAGAAYDLLAAWSAQLSLDFDFATDGQSFSRSQKFAQLKTLGNEYARRMLPLGMRAAWRSDVGSW